MTSFRKTAIVLAVSAGLAAAGCGSTDGPQSQPGTQAVVPAESGISSVTTTPTSSASSSASAPSDIAPACTAFAAALTKTPNEKGGTGTGDFLKALEAERAGGKSDTYGYSFWVDFYAPPYLPASAPDAIRTPIEAFGETVKQISDDLKADPNTSVAWSTMASAYKDAAVQCDEAGSPLQ